MCGLYGVYSKRRMGKLHIDMFESLALYSLKRGTHATGMALVSKDYDKKRKKNKIYVDWFKDSVDATFFFRDKETKSILNMKNKHLLMGHNRDATSGELDAQSAHPFEHKNIVGCHNGTIYDSEYRPNDHFLSDSDRLFFNIAKDGLSQTAQKLRNGHMALTFIDSKKDVFYIIRNVKRPMFLQWSKDGNTLIYASEKDFLDNLTTCLDIKWEEVRNLKPEVLFSIDLQTSEINEAEVKLEKQFNFPVGQRRSHSTPISAANNTSVPMLGGKSKKQQKKEKRRLEKIRRQAAQRMKNRGSEKRDVPLILKVNDGPDIEFYYSSEVEEEFVCYYGNVHVPLTAYMRLLSTGCAWCGTVSEAYEPVLWMSKDTYVCPNCRDEPLLHHMITGEEKIEEVS